LAQSNVRISRHCCALIMFACVFKPDGCHSCITREVSADVVKVDLAALQLQHSLGSTCEDTGSTRCESPKDVADAIPDSTTSIGSLSISRSLTADDLEDVLTQFQVPLLFTTVQAGQHMDPVSGCKDVKGNEICKVAVPDGEPESEPAVSEVRTTEPAAAAAELESQASSVRLLGSRGPQVVKHQCKQKRKEARLSRPQQKTKYSLDEARWQPAPVVKAKVDAFLAANGFKSVNAKRRRLLTSSYPLHIAVGKNNAEMVELLLMRGANPAKEDWLGKTPRQLAASLNKTRSHDEVMSVFSRTRDAAWQLHARQYQRA